LRILPQQVTVAAPGANPNQALAQQLQPEKRMFARERAFELSQRGRANPQ
jgi:hypothetical protein